MEIFYHISWRRNSGAGGSCTSTTVASDTLLTGQGSLTCLSGCSGTVSTMAYKCTDFSISENWSYGENRVLYTFPSEPVLIIGFTGCCWISPFDRSWRISSTFSVKPRNDTGVINSTPRAITSPVIRVQEGCNHTIAIPVTDPDNDIIRCRWAGSSECGGICGRIPGAILNQDSCTITYEANKGTGYKAVALMIEDFTISSSTPFSSVALQFLVYVFNSDQPCSTSPMFIPPTIRQDSCIAIQAGETFSTKLIADSHSSDVSVSEIETVSPSGLVKGDVTQIGGSNAYYVNISWTPNAEQQNQTHLFCYTAINSDGLGSEQTCIRFYTGISAPKPLEASSSPNKQLVHPSNTTWSINFDRDIQRPSVIAFITFFRKDTDEVVYMIDTSSSAEVSFEQPNKLLIIPNYSFEEKQEFYITFEHGVVKGFEGCEPGNEPVQEKKFWTFTTRDVTPPDINFVFQPSISNANISFVWESNENVIWQCAITHNLTEIQINCSEGSWSGYNLSEGKYILMIEAVDDAGNRASKYHTFYIDLTAPLVLILNKPSLLSNDRTAYFRFKCNEACSYFKCYFSESHEYISCTSGTYTTPILQHNMNYTFSVRGIDQVGNEGESVLYTWTTDFEAPVVFGINDISIPCANKTLPEYTGQALAADNITDAPTVSYTDYKTPCFIRRTWIAEDEAGNTAIVVQIITLEFLPTLTLLPVVIEPCDSGDYPVHVSSDTAIAPNPCRRLIEQMYEDSVAEYTCPSNFTRSWTVIDKCSEFNATSMQTLILYDICPPHACGRNETIPHGTCIFGKCICNKPWYGEDCTEIIYEPIIEQINDVELQEAESYRQHINLTQGTPPLTWTLLLGPNYVLVNQHTGEISWLFPQSGRHRVLVQVENVVGKTTIEWYIHVIPGYNASLDPIISNIFSEAKAIYLSGHVEYVDGNVVKNILASIVPVYIDVISNGDKRVVKTLTEMDGSFSTVFYPASTEYGMYVAAARHPQSPEETAQIEWSILGMMASPQVVYLSASTVSNITKTFYNVTLLTNDGPLPLHSLNATVNLGTITNLNVQLTFGTLSTVDSLKSGDSVALNIIIEAAGALNVLFPVTIQTAEGIMLHLSVYLQIKQILPNLVVSPPSVNARVIRGSSRIFQFNVSNDGTVTANNVQAALPTTTFISFISFGNEQQAEGKLTLRSRETAILSVQLKVPSSQELGEVTGNMVIYAAETSTRIPFKFTISSNVNMNLTVSVEDEYTYFSAGQPLVSGALVHIYNYQLGLRLTLKADNGTVTFFNIREDRYELFVEGPNHQSNKQIIVTSIDNPKITIFLVRRAVTYTWSVTPVTFEDTYKITLEADFETHVPIPVVTVTPREINLEELELGLVDTFQLNITNHGLIRAENIQFESPNHPFLYFKTTLEMLGDLEPLSSVLVAVNVKRKTTEKRLARAAAIVYASYAFDVFYSYVCGELVIKSIQVQLLKSEYRLPEVSLVTRPRPRPIALDLYLAIQVIYLDLDLDLGIQDQT